MKKHSMSGSKMTRDKALGAYRRFAERGIANPDELDLRDAEVQEANEFFDQWQSQRDVAVRGSGDEARRANFEKTKFYIDAGFTDPAYLRDVLERFTLEADDIKKRPGSPERAKLGREYTEEIKRIRDLLML
jgi:hypothetical protein